MAMILVAAAVIIFALPVLGLVAFVANKAMDGVRLFLTCKERKALRVTRRIALRRSRRLKEREVAVTR